jgi:hypothetical protein
MLTVNAASSQSMNGPIAVVAVVVATEVFAEVFAIGRSPRALSTRSWRQPPRRRPVRADAERDVSPCASIPTARIGESTRGVLAVAAAFGCSLPNIHYVVHRKLYAWVR